MDSLRGIGGSLFGVNTHAEDPAPMPGEWPAASEAPTSRLIEGHFGTKPPDVGYWVNGGLRSCGRVGRAAFGTAGFIGGGPVGGTLAGAGGFLALGTVGVVGGATIAAGQYLAPRLGNLAIDAVNLADQSVRSLWGKPTDAPSEVAHPETAAPEAAAEEEEAQAACDSGAHSGAMA